MIGQSSGIEQKPAEGAPVGNLGTGLGGKTKAKAPPKHWLEYAVFLFVVITAIATGLAAYYTRHQWLTATDTEHRQLRAYLGISFAAINEKDRTIEFDLSNGGQTPAFQVSGGLNLASQVGGSKIPSDFTFPEGEAEHEIHQAFGHILPQKSETIRFQLGAGEIDVLKKARTDDVAVYIYGSFLYLDVFGVKQSCNFAYIAKSNQIFQADRHNDCS